MTFDGNLLDLFEDTVTIEPYSSTTSAQVHSFGSAVTYPAIIESGAKRVINQQGREITSTIRVTIPERVHIDQRSRLTLPSGFVPQQPQILSITHIKGLGLDHTVIAS